STLRFVLRHIPWIPRVAGEKYDCSDADGVLWIDPSDLSRSLATPTVHDLLPHLPRELASQAAGSTARQLGIKTPDDFNRDDGILCTLQAHGMKGSRRSWCGALEPRPHSLSRRSKRCPRPQLEK